jgi:tRNA uridine 5-carboxymethylaminomethyl modification enzyme
VTVAALRAQSTGLPSRAPGAQKALGELLSDPQLAAILPDIEIEAKYAGYIERDKESARRMHELESKSIPRAFNFAGIHELRNEAKQSLTKFRPQTIGQASRLEGMTPNDLTVLMIHLRGKNGGGSP